MTDPTTQTPATPNSEPTQPTPATPAEKMVPESDVLKAKGGLQSKLDAATSQVNEEHAGRLKAETRVQALEETVNKSAEQLKELETLKATLESKTKSESEAMNKALEYRKKWTVKEFGATEDSVKDLNMEQLDMFERALRVVKTTTGGGNYATGGGGSTPAPTNSVDRALRILQNAQKGTPNQSK